MSFSGPAPIFRWENFFEDVQDGAPKRDVNVGWEKPW